MRNCSVREHESAVPETVQQAFSERVSEWSKFKRPPPWQIEGVFNDYPYGFGTFKTKAPILYVCPQTLSVKSEKGLESGLNKIDVAYFQFNPNTDGLFRPESVLTIRTANRKSEVSRLRLISDTQRQRDFSLPQFLDVELAKQTRISASYQSPNSDGPSFRYSLDLSYYTPGWSRDLTDRLRELDIRNLLAVHPQVMDPNGWFEIERARVGEANLEALLAGNNTDNYYGKWVTFQERIRFRPEGSAWHVELHFPRELSRDLGDVLVNERTRRNPISAPHKLDETWRRTEVFGGIGASAGFNDGEDPGFYIHPRIL